MSSRLAAQPATASGTTGVTTSAGGGVWQTPMEPDYDQSYSVPV